MRIFNFTIGDLIFVFVCNSAFTRSGFKHSARMTVRDKNNNCHDLSKSVCNYINRTWECYPFQSVISNCVYEYKRDAENKNYNRFLNDTGYKIITKKRRSQFEEYLKVNDPYYQFMEELREKIDRY